MFYSTQTGPGTPQGSGEQVARCPTWHLTH